MTLQTAMQDACNAVGIVPPSYTKLGQWVKCPVKGKSAANGSGRVMVFDDGKGGIACMAIRGAIQKANAPRASDPKRVLTGPTCKEVEMANEHICNVSGCGNIARARGWCVSHYQRWKRHGDPRAGGAVRPAKGSVQVWLNQHTDHTGDECLIWPFACDPSGYGVVNIGGRKCFAHRVMCEAVYGLPTVHDLLVCHSCGNGHLGCVNPEHLRWGTPAENSANMVKHGTVYRGEKCVSAKLTEEDVRSIRCLAGVLHQKEIAGAFGVSRRTVGDVINGRTWGWLE